MIGKRNRFHGYGSLRAVYQHGKTARGPLIGLKFSQRDPSRPYRVAVVVSRKVSKSAVVRNRIRRRIYEQIRLADQNIIPGTDMVFTVFNEQIATLESARLKEIVEQLIAKTTSSN